MEKTSQDKIAKAKKFVKQFHKMKKSDINQLLLDEVGEPLILFFQEYCQHLAEASPEKIKDFLPTVMTLGYLISHFEFEDSPRSI